MRSDALIVPPIGGRRGYIASEQSRDLSNALYRMTRERDDAESREIALHRLLVAVLTQGFGGEVFVDASLLDDEIAPIRTEYDARDGKTRVWLEPTEPQEGNTK